MNQKSFKLLKGLIKSNKNKVVTPILASQLGRTEGKRWKHDKGLLAIFYND
jgi:hypothetical protein